MAGLFISGRFSIPGLIAGRLFHILDGNKIKLPENEYQKPNRLKLKECEL